MTPEEARAVLDRVGREAGLDLMAVADAAELKRSSNGFSERTLDRMDRAICGAIRLSDAVIEDIVDGPTLLYFQHYRVANARLDQAAFSLAAAIATMGYRAIPIPASQITDWARQRGQVSHKHAAAQAGIGWIGRSNLLVTPEFGGRVRLVTVLTDLPLVPDKPLERNCGDCMECAKACPAGAIGPTREEFDHRGCLEKLKEFKNKYSIGQLVCGVCVKACRGGR